MKGAVATALVIALLSQGSAGAGEVIGHSTVSLSGDEIRDVFLGEKQFAGNLKLVPVDNTMIHA